METGYLDELELEDVREFLENGNGVIVDTLPPEHFAARHLPGAVNACVYEVTFLDTMASVAPDKATPVLLYGAGPKSLDCRHAADKLLRNGYAEVAVFAGGLEDWHAAGLALEGEAAGVVAPPHPPLVLEDKVYKLVPGESLIRWVGRNGNGGHNGVLIVSSGELKPLGEPSGIFTLDMNSIRNLDLEGDDMRPVLEAHLKSDDFFFTSLFPQASFEVTQLRLVEDGEATRPNGMMQGRLGIRGLTHEIAFPVHLRNLEEGKLALMANLDLDRTQWGVIYGSSRFFQHLGYHVVYDFVSVEFRVVLG